MQLALSRRKFLEWGALGAAGLAGATLLPGCVTPALAPGRGVRLGGGHDSAAHPGHGDGGGGTAAPAAGGVTAGTGPATAGQPARHSDFDPMAYLHAFDYGKVTRLAGGRTLREYTITAEDREVEVAPGVWYPAWTFNGTVPGPTLRCTEGDLLRIHFTNAGAHPHSIHFHGIHPPAMDGFAGVATGGSTVYEFTAEPFGVLPYHCHVMSLKKHIAKGLYGTLIVDPPGGRPPAREMVMVMNGFDVDGDDENEFYTVNGVAFAYQRQRIPVKVGELVRIYLTNMTEFDAVNSFHLHAGMYHWYPYGTSLVPAFLTDNVTLGQGDRGIIEFRLKYPGAYMFHAHQSEFAELGWVGFFAATD